MPELPEVETVARQLSPLLTGRRLRGIEITDAKLQLPGAERLRGRVALGVARHGKEVMLRLGWPDGVCAAPGHVGLCVHLRMTGRLIWRADGDGPNAATFDSEQAMAHPQKLDRPPRARLTFEGGELLFIDVRRFGTMRLVALGGGEAGEAIGAGGAESEADLAQGAQHQIPQLDASWIDPMSDAFTPHALGDLLAGSRQALKPWLLRQDKLVGIGNIYASEALHEAALSPLRSAGTLRDPQIRALHKALRAVLNRAIRNGGTSFSDFQDTYGQRGRNAPRLRVYGREGEPCRRCAAPIVRIVQTSRSTFYCKKCQK